MATNKTTTTREYTNTGYTQDRLRDQAAGGATLTHMDSGVLGAACRIERGRSSVSAQVMKALKMNGSDGYQRRHTQRHWSERLPM